MKFVEEDELLISTVLITICEVGCIFFGDIYKKLHGLLLLSLWFGYHFIYKKKKLDSRYLVCLVIVAIFIIFKVVP